MQALSLEDFRGLTNQALSLRTKIDLEPPLDLTNTAEKKPLTHTNLNNRLLANKPIINLHRIFSKKNIAYFGWHSSRFLLFPPSPNHAH